MDSLIFNENNKIYIYENPTGFKKWMSGLGLRELKKYGSCELQPLPGCGGICIITKFEILEEYQNKGFGKKLLNHAIIKAKMDKYSKIMATVNQLSPKMHTLLKSAEFKQVDIFTNLKSNNEVAIYIL